MSTIFMLILTAGLDSLRTNSTLPEQRRQDIEEYCLAISGLWKQKISNSRLYVRREITSWDL